VGRAGELAVARGCLSVGCGAVVWGRYRQAGKLLAAAAELADADRHPRIRQQVEISQAQLDWFTGVWDGLLERVSILAGRDEPLALLGAVRLGLWHLAQGAHRRAEQHLGLALEQARRLGAVDDVLEPAAGLGRVRLAEGRAADAVRETDEPIRTIATRGIWVWATDVAPVRAEALVAAGQVETAAGLVSAYRRGLRDCPAPAGRAALLTCQAVLTEGRGDRAGAAAGFAEAAAAWERLPRPYDALLARERQARCLLAAGRCAPAVDLLYRTFQGLSALGARGDAGRVAGRLRECGVDARREWRRGRRGYGDQLSPRELDVVRLVATGATNREVAAALCRSPKTVAGQLSSAMRKLGASSRTEVAVAALRAGILPDTAGSGGHRAGR
jgi:DNA-binding CsgD family transcriptional regulator/tetratricopeptide (TPR) repeat protein